MSAALSKLALFHLDKHPDEAARILERHDPAAVARLLVEAPGAQACALLERLPPRMAADCFEHLPLDTAGPILAQLRVPTAVSLLRLVSEPVRRDLLAALSPRAVGPISRALRLAPQSAGALADPTALTLRLDLTAGQAVDYLRAGTEPIPATVFVLDRERRLAGAITVGMLLRAARSASLASLDLNRARQVTPRASVPALVRRRTFNAGPIAVVDTSGAFCGILSDEVLQRASDRSAPADFAHVAAALGELYWVGLRDLSGGLLAELRARSEPPGPVHGHR